MDTDSITELLELWRGGNSEAARTLVPLVYQQLRVIARRQLGGRQSQTLNTTALVHEAYLKLERRSRLSLENRNHFFAVAAKAMRQLLVDHARRRAADKRGGHADIVTIDDTDLPVAARAEELIDLNSALDRLSEVDEPLARLVELRFFAGLSVEETAAALNCSPRTVKRDWRKARAFLYRELTDGKAGS
jgi:RNA polymerase sigma factor (TIGR02999 family)